MSNRRGGGVRLSATCEICHLRVVVDASYRGCLNVMPGNGPHGGRVCTHCMGKITLAERRPDLQPPFLQDKTISISGAIDQQRNGSTSWQNLPEAGGPGAPSLKEMCTFTAATTRPPRDLGRMPQDLLAGMVGLLNARLKETEVENARLRYFAIAQHRQLIEANKKYPQEGYVDRYDARQPANPMRDRR